MLSSLLVSVSRLFCFSLTRFTLRSHRVHEQRNSPKPSPSSVRRWTAPAHTSSATTTSRRSSTTPVCWRACTAQTRQPLDTSRSSTATRPIWRATSAWPRWRGRVGSARRLRSTSSGRCQSTQRTRMRGMHHLLCLNMPLSCIECSFCRSMSHRMSGRCAVR